MLNNRTVGRRQGRQPLLKEWLGISQLVVRTALCIPRSVYSFLSPSLPSSSLNCLISTYKILLFCFCFFFFIFSPVPLWMDSEQVAVRRLTACWVKPQRHPSGDTRARGFKRPHMHIESLLINTVNGLSWLFALAANFRSSALLQHCPVLFPLFFLTEYRCSSDPTL